MPAVQCSAVQGSVQNVARRLGKCRSDRRMQIPCMVLIIEDVVFHVFLLLGFALVQSVQSKDNRIGHEILTLIFSFNYV